MTKIFGLPVILFWQALGLIVLAKFLFGNISGRKKCRCKCKYKYGKKWKEHFKGHFEEYCDGKDKTDGETSVEVAEAGPPREV